MWYYVQCNQFAIVNKKGKAENFEEIPSNLPIFILDINSVISKEQRQQFSKHLGFGRKGYTIAVESDSGFPCVLVESRMAKNKSSTQLSLEATKMQTCRTTWLAVVESDERLIVSQSSYTDPFGGSTRTEPKWNTSDKNIISLAKQALEGDVSWKL